MYVYMYIYIYIYLYVSMYVYIYVYIYIAPILGIYEPTAQSKLAVPRSLSGHHKVMEAYFHLIRAPCDEASLLALQAQEELWPDNIPPAEAGALRTSTNVLAYWYKSTNTDAYISRASCYSGSRGRRGFNSCNCCNSAICERTDD